MRRFLALSSAIALTVMMSSFTYAQVETVGEEMVAESFPEITIEFRNLRDATTGDELDNIGLQDLTFTTPVIEDLRIGDDQLTISVIGLTGSGDFNLDRGVPTTLGLGINSSGLDNAFDFDALLNESVTFAFNQDLFITAVDLNGSLFPSDIGLAEFFEVGGIEINGDNPGDIFSFINADSPDGLFVAAGDGVLFRALAGSGNIDSLTVQIAPPPAVPGPSPEVPEPSPAVPEPSTAVLLVSLGMIGVARRRRK